jgi:hypothetical protein
MLALQQNLAQHLDAIEDCLQRRRVLSCLCLLYSGIDVVGSLETGKSTRSTFVRWVEENMLKARPMPCTALELYAARCGILHTFTPDSDLSRKGGARKLNYAWGHASTDDLAKIAKALGRAEIAVHVRELIDSFRAGLDLYIEKVMQNPDRLRRVEESSSLWFTHLDRDTVANFLKDIEPKDK